MGFLSYLKTKNKYLTPFVVVLICGYALYLRLIKLSGHKLWADEYWQLHQMQSGFINMIKGFPANEFCPYLSGDYFLIYPFFKIFSYNKWGLAIPHIIFTILGFYLLYLLCKQHFKTIWGYLITFSIVCFNATLIWHATEIRVYAVLPTLALGCLYFCLKIVNSYDYLSKGKKIAIGAFFVATIWFHAYGILIYSFSLVYAIATKVIDKSFSAIRNKIFIFNIVILAIAMPLVLISVFGPNLSSEQYGFNTFEYIPNPLKNIVGFLKGVFGNLLGRKKLYFLLLGVLAPLILPLKDRFKQIAFLIILVCIPVGVILFINIKTHYWFIQRLFIWVMPFFALFLGWSWESSIIYFKKKLKNPAGNAQAEENTRLKSPEQGRR